MCASMQLTPIRFGAAAQPRLREATDPQLYGAEALLETFYYALNHRDLKALEATWSSSPFAQLNNPIGGIIRGGPQIVELYERIFTGGVQLEIEFSDVTVFAGGGHAVYAGRETGSYRPAGGPSTPLSIRTTRCLHYSAQRGAWEQVHHHGSLDDPQALAAYQAAVLGT
jgi:ketosteroid isomerase-like protein